MPVIIDPALPAASLLKAENAVFLAPREKDAELTMAFINLMPVKTDTERDFLRIIAPDRHTVDVKLVSMASHKSRNTSAEHIGRFYTPFDRLPTLPDCVIITGAPLENVRFEDVDYWDEVTGIFETLRRNGIPTLYICWAAYAALYHFYGVAMHLLDTKLSGVYPHHIDRPDSSLLKGVDEPFYIPHSRFATWDFDEIAALSEIAVDASGLPQGPYMLSSLRYPEHYFTGHGEYATQTLDNEYRRDLGKGMNPHIPLNYYPADDPSQQPADKWHETAVRIMSNWLDEAVTHKLNKTR